nr:MAG TPA: hypothetical protein [Caudoviricetes sp.]
MIQSFADSLHKCLIFFDNFSISARLRQTAIFLVIQTQIQTSFCFGLAYGRIIR